MTWQTTGRPPPGGTSSTGRSSPKRCEVGTPSRPPLDPSRPPLAGLTLVLMKKGRLRKTFVECVHKRLVAQTQTQTQTFLTPTHRVFNLRKRTPYIILPHMRNHGRTHQPSEGLLHIGRWHAHALIGFRLKHTTEQTVVRLCAASGIQQKHARATC